MAQGIAKDHSTLGLGLAPSSSQKPQSLPQNTNVTSASSAVSNPAKGDAHINKSRLLVPSFASPHDQYFTSPRETALPERPSTSGGPATRRLAGIHLTRRGEAQTRDDLHVPLVSAPAPAPSNNSLAQNVGVTYYNLPLLSRLRTAKATKVIITKSASTSRSSREEQKTSKEFQTYGHSSEDSLLDPSSIAMREYMSNLAVDEMPIGMALGSPSQAPTTAWSSHAHLQSQNSFSRAEVASPDSDTEWRSAAQPPKASKSSKWKLFGMFGKKAAATSQSSQGFYKLQPDRVQEPDWLNFPEPPVVEKKTSKGRGRTNSERRPHTAKPRLARAMTVPKEFPMDREGTPTAGKRVMVETPTDVPAEDEREEEQEEERIEKSMVRIDNAPLLAVDIPTIHMERYSVMFSSFLGPKASSQSSSSSLLARRQATLDRLTTVNETIAELEREEQSLTRSQTASPRPATSPHHAQSPSFSLFPGGSTLAPASPAQPTPSGHHRYNTSPAAISPLKHLLSATPSSASPSPNAQLGTNAEIRTLTPASSPPSRISPTPPHAADPWPNHRPSVVSPTSTVDSDAGPSTPEKTQPLAPLKWRLQEPDRAVMVSRQNLTPSSDSVRARATTADQHQHHHRQRRQKSASEESAASMAISPAASLTDTITTVDANYTQLQARPVHRMNIPRKPSVSSYSGADAAPAPTRDVTAGKFATAAANKLTMGARERAEAEAPTTGKFGTAAANKLTMGARERADAEALIRDAAEVSIARQISVSRQQREMLVSARMKGAVVGSGGDGEGEGKRREVKMEKILVMREKRVLTPMVVEVQQGRGGEGMGQRRSEHGLLVGFEKA